MKTKKTIKHNKSIFQNQNRGFTLIELLIVMALIGILAALTFGLMGNLSKKSEEKVTRVIIKKVVSAIEDFKGDNGTYPILSKDDAKEGGKFLYTELVVYPIIEEGSTSRIALRQDANFMENISDRDGNGRQSTVTRVYLDLSSSTNIAQKNDDGDDLIVDGWSTETRPTPLYYISQDINSDGISDIGYYNETYDLWSPGSPEEAGTNTDVEQQNNNPSRIGNW